MTRGLNSFDDLIKCDVIYFGELQRKRPEVLRRKPGKFGLFEHWEY
jgi:hypothetical protein